MTARSDLVTFRQSLARRSLSAVVDGAVQPDESVLSRQSVCFEYIYVIGEKNLSLRCWNSNLSHDRSKTAGEGLTHLLP